MKRLKACTNKIHLPRELVFDVLLRLPAKSLMRFKRVSKLWRSVIADSLFVEAHQTRSRSRSGSSGLLVTFPDADHSEQHFFFSTDRGKSISYQLKLAISGEEDAVTQVIDGLVCFRNADDYRVSICNVSTLEIMSLPESSFSGEEVEGTPHYYFGFDPIDGEYKVLNVQTTTIVSSTSGDGEPVPHRRGRRRCGKCEILTLGRDSSWRRIDPPPHLFRSQSFCFKGFLHWMVIDSSVQIDYDRNQQRPRDLLLVVFDLQQERFRVISTPVWVPQGHYDIVQVREDLCLSSAARCHISGLLNLYILPKLWNNKDNELRWSMTFVSLPPVVRNLGCFSAVGTLFTGDAILTTSQLSSQMRVFSCSPTQKPISVTDLFNGKPQLNHKWCRIELGNFPPPYPDLVSSSSPGIRVCIYHHVEDIVSLRDLIIAKQPREMAISSEE